jgi:hypothetical protein
MRKKGKDIAMPAVVEPLPLGLGHSGSQGRLYVGSGAGLGP